MRNKSGVIVVLTAIVLASFLFVQVRSDEDNEASDFTKVSAVEHRSDFFTNRNLNELDAVTYATYAEMKDDLTEELPFVHKITKKEFVGGRAEPDGITWTGYFEK